MNKLQKNRRDKYLSEKMRAPKTLKLTEYEDWIKFYVWVAEQEWWERHDFNRYLGEYKNLEDATYHYLKEKDVQKT